MPKSTLRSLRARLRQVRNLMKEITEIAGNDPVRLGEIIDLDGEWMEWIKNEIEPRFHEW